MSALTPRVLRSPRRQSRSPPLRRGRRRPGDAWDMVPLRRVVKEVGGSANYLIITKTNYSDWSLLMRVMLQARGLWEAVETGDVDFQEDRMALEAVLKAVPADLLPVLAVKETAKDAWDAIKTMRVGVDRVRKSKVHELRKQFDAIEFKEGESVEEFSVRLSGLVNNLAVLGIQLEESNVCEKFLHVVPEHLE